MENRIEKQIELKAPISRVWRALTDHREFNEWFGVKLESPFVPGKATSGPVGCPGHEHLKMEVIVQKMEPEHFFSFTWHPYAIDPTVDYSTETPTLVEFKLRESATGTILELTESGFENISSTRVSDAFRMNNNGWEQQLKNIQAHLANA